MTNLSPTAQAVLDAFLTQWDVYAVDDARHAMAAALRAAADAVSVSPYTIEHAQFWSELHDIAAELEGAQ